MGILNNPCTLAVLLMREDLSLSPHKKGSEASPASFFSSHFYAQLLVPSAAVSFPAGLSAGADAILLIPLSQVLIPPNS